MDIKFFMMVMALLQVGYSASLRKRMRNLLYETVGDISNGILVHLLDIKDRNVDFNSKEGRNLIYEGFKKYYEFNHPSQSQCFALTIIREMNKVRSDGRYSTELEYFDTVRILRNSPFFDLHLDVLGVHYENDYPFYKPGLSSRIDCSATEEDLFDFNVFENKFRKRLTEELKDWEQEMNQMREDAFREYYKNRQRHKSTTVTTPEINHHTEPTIMKPPGFNQQEYIVSTEHMINRQQKSILKKPEINPQSTVATEYVVNRHQHKPILMETEVNHHTESSVKRQPEINLQESDVRMEPVNNHNYQNEPEVEHYITSTKHPDEPEYSASTEPEFNLRTTVTMKPATMHPDEREYSPSTESEFNLNLGTTVTMKPATKHPDEPEYSASTEPEFNLNLGTTVTRKPDDNIKPNDNYHQSESNVDTEL